MEFPDVRGQLLRSKAERESRVQGCVAERERIDSARAERRLEQTLGEVLAMESAYGGDD